MNNLMLNGNRPDNAVLLHSYSFPDGVIMSSEAFKRFLDLASPSEADSASYALISASEAAYLDLDWVAQHEVAGLLVSSYETQ